MFIPEVFNGIDNGEITLVYEEREKLKKLEGFLPDRHFLPKYYSKSLESFVSGISVKNVEEIISPVASSIRNYLDLKVNDYIYEVSEENGGVFECEGISLHINYAPDPEKLNEVILTIQLDLKKNSDFNPDEITGFFSCGFHYARSFLKEGFHLKSFIEQYETFFIKNTDQGKANYNLEASEFELEFPLTGRKIILTEHEIKVYFSSNYTVSDFFKSADPVTGS